MRAEPSDFATRLRELRMKRGLRQVDLAKTVGVAQTTIANYERKLRFPDEPMLGRFADFFDVGFDFLLGRTDVARSPEAPLVLAGKTPFSGIAGTPARYLAALRGRGFEAAVRLVESAMRAGLSVTQIYLEVLAPALRETGRLWERGELRVGEEHSISEATQRIMSRIVPGSRAAGSRSGERRCLALAVPCEQHTIGSRMVADLLRLDGWNVVYPRGNLCVRHVIEMLQPRPPGLLALSVTLGENVGGADDLISAIRSRRSLRGVRILVGGQAFQNRPFIWREIGADATAEDAGSAVKAANELLDRLRG
jgi:methanogenic corrinoid protein MtbC1/DNA-binding XRE family transcriptional regulator